MSLIEITVYYFLFAIIISSLFPDLLFYFVYFFFFLFFFFLFIQDFFILKRGGIKLRGRNQQFIGVKNLHCKFIFTFILTFPFHLIINRKLLIDFCVYVWEIGFGKDKMFFFFILKTFNLIL